MITKEEYYVEGLKVIEYLVVKFDLANSSKADDLRSYLEEELVKKSFKIDLDRIENTAHLWGNLKIWLERNTIDFFRTCKSIEDREHLVSDFRTEDKSDRYKFLYEVVGYEVDFLENLVMEEAYQKLTEEEAKVLSNLLKGFNDTQTAQQLGTYKMKVNRIRKKICEKLSKNM